MQMDCLHKVSPYCNRVATKKYFFWRTQIHSVQNFKGTERKAHICTAAIMH